METRPKDHGWTPSSVARVAKVTTYEAWVTLGWMVRNVFVTSDDQGAWTYY